MDLQIVSGESLDHTHPHGLWRQPGPHTSTWSLVSELTTDRPQQAAQAKDINMALGYNIGHSQQHGLSSTRVHIHNYGFR